MRFDCTINLKAAGFCKTNAIILLSAGILFSAAQACGAAEISALTSKSAAVLGSAYQSDKELLIGQACLTGTERDAGAAVSTFSFEQSLSESQAAEQLGLEAGGRARFGATEVSASARFLQSTVSNAYSISSVWLSDYQLPVQRLDAPSLTQIGEAVSGNFERWEETCGDEYVFEIQRGAKLFFSIRVDFASESMKQQFQANFSISGPLYEASANLQQASERFSRETTVTLSAMQIGGDVSQITGIFGGTSGTRNYVQCTLGSFENCASVIEAALNYATDLNTGFPSQVALNPTPLMYRSAKYATAGLLVSPPPFIAEVTREARRQLHLIFEKNFRLLILANRLLEHGLHGDKRADILFERETLEANIVIILEAADSCYDLPASCHEKVQDLRLASINENVFELPGIPQASFRLLTSDRGVWPRESSVEFMRNALSSVRENENVYFVQEGGVSISHYSVGPRDVGLAELGAEGGASVVLHVEGVALNEAILYFEDRRLGSVQLTPGTQLFPGKRDNDSASLVVRTTRQIPGWLDFDIDSYRESLWDDELPVADGAFYIVVRDDFGREVRFDVEYQTWERSVQTMNGRRVVIETFTFKNKWWDSGSDGTSLLGDEGWTSIGEQREELGLPDNE